MSDMIAVAKKREDWVKAKAKAYNPRTINPVGKSCKKPGSRHLAIFARCWQCVHLDDDPGLPTRIRDCVNSAKCSLHPHRPYQLAYRESISALRETAPPAPPPGTIVSLMERARLDPESRTSAVKAYCWTCQGGGDDTRGGANGNIRDMVRECPVFNCALWDVRPWKFSESDKEPQATI